MGLYVQHDHHQEELTHFIEQNQTLMMTFTQLVVLLVEDHR